MKRMAEGHQFPHPVIFEPSSTHTHTIILLHGRGSTGQEFAEDLFAIQLSKENETLRSRFPNYRWVFPSSHEIWSTVFQENMSAWFEAHSMTDISARAELQVSGIKESVKYIQSLLDEEIRQLRNSSKHIIVGGISQGAAIGLWVILSDSRSLGGFFGASSWLPFYKDIISYLDGERCKSCDGVPDNKELGLQFVDSMIAWRTSNHAAGICSQCPIFLGHGIDDAYVDIELGRAAKDIFEKVGYAVAWKEYKGADEEGHWLKEPEQVKDMAMFLEHATMNQY